MAASAEEAGAIADRIGGPVVLKVVAPAIIHKSDVGGVILNLQGGAAARAGYRRIVEAVAGHAPDTVITGVLVQGMAPPGRETIVGRSRDSSFGPMLMFGLGGVYVEVWRDVVFRMAPVARSEAREMIEGLKAAKLLAGVRGQAPIDYRAAEDVLLRVSQLFEDFPEIVELDLNPLLTYPEGAVAADARVVLAR